MRDAWEVLEERRASRPWVPARKEHRGSPGWEVVAEEFPLNDGPVPFDVRAVFTCPIGGTVGKRLPAGPNLHADPLPEIERLLSITA
jgi:hypothetical protein